MANSKTDGAGVFKTITVLALVICLECTLVDLQPLTLSVQHIVVQHYQKNCLLCLEYCISTSKISPGMSIFCIWKYAIYVVMLHVKLPEKFSLAFRILHEYLQHISWNVNCLYLEVLYLMSTN